MADGTNLPGQWRVAGRRRKGERPRDLKLTHYDGGWDVTLGIVREGEPKAAASITLDQDGLYELLDSLEDVAREISQAQFDASGLGEAAA